MADPSGGTSSPKQGLPSLRGFFNIPPPKAQPPPSLSKTNSILSSTSDNYSPIDGGQFSPTSPQAPSTNSNSNNSSNRTTMSPETLPEAPKLAFSRNTIRLPQAPVLESSSRPLTMMNNAAPHGEGLLRQSLMPSGSTDHLGSVRNLANSTLRPMSSLEILNSEKSDPTKTIVVRVSVPSKGIQKAMRSNLTDTVWAVRRQLMDKIQNELRDSMNYGLFLPGTQGKQGKFLEEKRDLSSYRFENTVLLEYIPKQKLSSSPAGDDEANSKKKQKKFVEDVQKGNVEKVREKCAQGLDPNFWTESEETTPLAIAVLNNDIEMISALVECGAFLDYRLGGKEAWKTPLHIAASANKPEVVQTLLNFGAWANVSDSAGLTPLFFAVMNDCVECVHRLLLAKAETERFDENGKGPLHQACLNNNEHVTWLLLDFGANMNALNIAGNSPLHVAATRNSKLSLKWLLIRGANVDALNKIGQTAQQAAAMSGNSEIVEMIKNFKTEDIIPPPPRPFPNETQEFTCIPPYMCKDSPASSPARQTMMHPKEASDSGDGIKEIKQAHRRSLLGNRFSEHIRAYSEPVNRRISMTKTNSDSQMPINKVKVEPSVEDSKESLASPTLEKRGSVRRTTMAPSKKSSVPPPPNNKTASTSTLDVPASPEPNSDSRPTSLGQLSKHKSLTSLGQAPAVPQEKPLDLRHLSLTSLAEAYNITGPTKISRVMSSSYSSLTYKARSASKSQLDLQEYEQDESQLTTLRSSLESEELKAAFSKAGFDIESLVKTITTLESSVRNIGVRAAKAESEVRRLRNEKLSLEKELAQVKEIK